MKHTATSAKTALSGPAVASGLGGWASAPAIAKQANRMIVRTTIRRTSEYPCLRLCITSAPRRRVMPDAEPPKPERHAQKDEAERRRETEQFRRDTGPIGAAEHRRDRKVRDAPERHDERQEVAKPAGVQVERVLRRLDAS